MTVRSEIVPGDKPEAAARPHVTLADLAREAGTSASTASRALSGHGYVSPEARERLLAAAERLGYVANASARALKQQKSRVIGVVVTDLSNQFYASLAAGMDQTLRAAGYHMVVVGDSGEAAEELEGARNFVAMRAPGVIITPVGVDASTLLRKHGVAVVEIDRQFATEACDAVVIDNERGAADATSHLFGLGHRRVALLVMATQWTSNAGRLRGYRFAHDESGIPVDERLVVRIPLHAPDLEARIEELLDVERPTALFAGSNLLAESAWRVLRRLELDIPRDVSLVGFDDVPWMQMVEPGITVVEQPAVEMGRRAAKLLLERLEDPWRAPVIERLEPRLVVRGSTAAPPA